MPESTVIKTKRDGQILFADSGAVNTYTIIREDGSFTLNVADHSIVHVLDRGVIGSTPLIRIGDEAPMSGGFSAYLSDLGDTANSYTSLNDLIMRFNARYVASNWISTMGANSDVFTMTLTYTIDGTPFGEADKSLVIPFVVLRGNVAEGDPTKFACSFTSYAVRPTLS
jgi:hypothetical protein